MYMTIVLELLTERTELYEQLAADALQAPADRGDMRPRN